MKEEKHFGQGSHGVFEKKKEKAKKGCNGEQLDYTDECSEVEDGKRLERRLLDVH